MNIKFWTKLTPVTNHSGSEIEVRDYNNKDFLVGWLIAYNKEEVEDYLRDMNFYKGWKISSDMIEGEAKYLIKHAEFIGIIPF